MKFIQGIGTGIFIAAAFLLLVQVSGVFADNGSAANAPNALFGNAFTYQGRLSVDGVPADGMYNIRIRFFDVAIEGDQQFEFNTETLVQDGLFSILVDPGSQIDGDRVFIEVAAQAQPGAGDYQVLGPRQELTPAPYAVFAKSLSTEASAGFIKNGTVTQPSSNFHISGDGIAEGVLDASSYMIDGQFVVRWIDDIYGLFLGPSSGRFDATGLANTMVGYQAGSSLSSGFGNVGLGESSLARVDSGSENVAVGYGALSNLESGEENTAVGRNAGARNESGSGNTLVGKSAGDYINGNNNTAIGVNAGTLFTTGTENVFVGHSAGNGGAFDSAGSQNTAVGTNSGFGLTSGVKNAFLGDRSGEDVSTGAGNTILGADAGKLMTTASNSTIVGFESGASSDAANNAFLGWRSGFNVTSGGTNTFIGQLAGVGISTGSSNTALGAVANFGANNMTNATVIGAGAQAAASNQVQLGRNGFDTVRIGTLATGTVTGLCVTPLNVLASCPASSIRYKTNVADYAGSLDVLAQLRPVTFDWKSDGTHDLGFVAEEIAAIDPLLATYRDGQVEGVKYDRISTVLVNAVKDQQVQIDALSRGVTPVDDARFAAIESRLVEEHGFSLTMALGLALVAGIAGGAIGFAASRMRNPSAAMA